MMETNRTYERIVEQVNRITELCKAAIGKTNDLKLARDIKEIGEAAIHIVSITEEEVKISDPDGPGAA